MSHTDTDALAREMLAALDGGLPVQPPSERFPGLDFATAYAVARNAERLRRERGETPVGRKIGYTNRNIWAQYNMDQPIWDHMYGHTVHHAEGGSAVLSLAGLPEPRIEPEIALKLSAAPPIGCTDPVEVLACVEWIARSFEVVQCHYPGWKFAGPDSVVDFSHHGALIVGEPLPVSRGDLASFADALSDCRVTLSRNGEVVDSGTGANALGHPALALAHLADVIASQPDAPPLAAGEIITTGTLTAAMPATPGETWTTTTDGLKLPPLSVRFE